MKKILILGSGMVAQPIIRYLLKNNFLVTVASNTPERAGKMIDNHPNGLNINWSVEDSAQLEKLVEANDIVVSLLPYVFHLQVAEIAIKFRKNMVTTSYVKPEMQQLDSEAKKAGIIILNELGLDPGIDHMSAMRIIDKVHKNKGKIEVFYSICGALPAPEAIDNPFGYKFSWSPKGVVMASNNDAKYLKDGEEVKILTENLFKNPLQVHFPEIGLLEIYPNRDSISYIDIYGIPEVKTMYRGTFRFQHWCEILDVIKKLKLVSDEKLNLEGKTFNEMTKMKIAENYPELSEHSIAWKGMQWLGLFDDKPMNRKIDSSFEVTSDLMLEKMLLKENERDLIVMQHSFLASYPNGKKEVIRSRMLDFGIPFGDTSIARTVALPAAIGVKMIAEGKIQSKGVYRPVIQEIYEPILTELELMNIVMNEEFGLPETTPIP